MVSDLTSTVACLLLRINLYGSHIQAVKEHLAQAIFECTPVRVVPKRSSQCATKTWKGPWRWVWTLVPPWAEVKVLCEYRRMLQAEPSKVSVRAKKRNLPQPGPLDVGKCYAEIRVVDKIFSEYALKKMGINHKGKEWMMLRGSRWGLVYQIATDAPVAMEKAMVCARIASQEGHDYLKGMAVTAAVLGQSCFRDLLHFPGFGQDLQHNAQ